MFSRAGMNNIWTQVTDGHDFFYRFYNILGFSASVQFHESKLSENNILNSDSFCRGVRFQRVPPSLSLKSKTNLNPPGHIPVLFKYFYCKKLNNVQNKKIIMFMFDINSL